MDGLKRLAETLAGHEDILCKFAIYHVPLYPSHRPFEGSASRLGRTHWEPLFFFYGLTAAFENHDHTLKRSKLLRKGQPAEDGVLYLGDGSFGVDPRTVDPQTRPYLEKQAGLGHFWIVDLAPEGITYRAIGESGEPLDEHRQTARARAEPATASIRR